MLLDSDFLLQLNFKSNRYDSGTGHRAQAAQGVIKDSYYYDFTLRLVPYALRHYFDLRNYKGLAVSDNI